MSNQRADNKNAIQRNQHERKNAGNNEATNQKSADSRFGQQKDIRQGGQSAGTNQYSPNRGEDE